MVTSLRIWVILSIAVLLAAAENRVAGTNNPFVINTWGFVDATATAWETLVDHAHNKHAALNSVEAVRLYLHRRTKPV